MDNYGSKENTKLIIGDCRKTLAMCIQNKELVEFSMAFVDVDLYETAKSIFFDLDRIAKGGEVILVHDGSSPGIQSALEDYSRLSKHRLIIKNKFLISKVGQYYNSNDMVEISIRG